jgi:preprotein translocase subunit YajC
MRLHRFSLFLLTLSLSSAMYAQDAPASPPQGQTQGQSRGYGRGMGMGGGFGMGSGVAGTVTEATADHFTIKDFSGQTWTVHFSVNTRIMKQPPRRERGAQAGQSQNQAPNQEGGGMQPWMPETIKATDIRVGDTIMAVGEVDRDAKSVGAVGIMLADPESAQRMREMQANYGKTWLMGKVTAISETKLTIEGGMDRAPHTFVADENTTFRRRREPITLADIQVGDNVRVDGAVKDGQFVASSVSVMAFPQARGGPVPHQGPPQ